MNITRLVLTEYDNKGWGREDSKYENPDWPLIEKSIRRLDRFRFPYVWLFKEESEDGPQLTITGGKGKFHLYMSDDEGEYIILNADKGDDIVEVWESDQGFETYDHELLDDVDDVVKIAKHYYEFGEKHPDFEWVDS